MPLQVTSDNLEITPSMKALAEQKISKILAKLADYPEDLVDTRVVMNTGSAEGTFEAKGSLKTNGKTIVGEDFEYNLESALVKAVDDALRQYNKEKEKKEAKAWQERRDMKVFKDEEDE